MAASTSPLAMPITSVAAKSTVKSGARMVAIAPPTWPIAAIRNRTPIPRRSHNGPPSRMEKPKPQKAAPAIQPTLVLVSENSRSKSPMMSPRMANDIAVAIRAMQPAVNRRRAAIGSVRGARVDVVMGCSSLHPKATRLKALKLLVRRVQANTHHLPISHGEATFRRRPELPLAGGLEEDRVVFGLQAGEKG